MKLSRVIPFFVTIFMVTPLLASPLSFVDSLDELLKAHVKSITFEEGTQTLINYKAWRQDSNHKKAMHALKNSNPSKLNGEKEKLAYWINAYNLLTVDLIIQKNEKHSIRNLGGTFSSPWTKYDWKIGYSEYTLDDIEHKILRKMNDPRIHMAIVCASLSCPDIRAEAFRPETLDAQLDDQVKLFVANASKGVKKENSRVKVSKIFDWFAKDFGGKKNVVKFISQYSDAIDENDELDGYLKYNWSLNTIK